MRRGRSGACWRCSWSCRCASSGWNGSGRCSCFAVSSLPRDVYVDVREYSRASISLVCKRHRLLTWSRIWASSLLTARIRVIVSLPGVSSKVGFAVSSTRVNYKSRSICARQTLECFCSFLLVRQEVGGRYISDYVMAPPDLEQNKDARRSRKPVL